MATFATTPVLECRKPTEADVLSKVGDPRACQAVILERQGAVDDDAGETLIVTEEFRAGLTRLGLDPATCHALIPRKLACRWLEAALAEPVKTSKARAVLNNLGVRELRESAGAGTISEGPFVWGSRWTLPVGTCAIVGVSP